MRWRCIDSVLRFLILCCAFVNCCYYSSRIVSLYSHSRMESYRNLYFVPLLMMLVAAALTQVGRPTWLRVSRLPLHILIRVWCSSCGVVRAW